MTCRSTWMIFWIDENHEPCCVSNNKIRSCTNQFEFNLILEVTMSTLLPYSCRICKTKGGCTNNDARSGSDKCVLDCMFYFILSELGIRWDRVL